MMSHSHSDRLKPDDRTPQQLAEAILTMPIARDADALQRETFGSLLQMAADADASLQQEWYGAADIGKRAYRLQVLLQDLAGGKTSLMPEEREALRDCLNVTAAIRRNCLQASQEGLDMCRDPAGTPEHGMGSTDEAVRVDGADMHYLQRQMADGVGQAIEPLFHALAGKFKVPLASPDIRY